MSDPVNPAHYAGRACADIGERLTANGYQILKYVWRLGKKDSEYVELGKAEWYADSEATLIAHLAARLGYMRTSPMTLDLDDPTAYFEHRIKDQPAFTQSVARMLWRGYDIHMICALVEIIKLERAKYAGA